MSEEEGSGGIVIPAAIARWGVPLVLGAALGGGGATGAWSFASNDVDALTVKVEALATEVRGMRLEMTRDRWTGTDHRAFLREELNPRLEAIDQRLREIERGGR